MRARVQDAIRGAWRLPRRRGAANLPGMDSDRTFSRATTIEEERLRGVTMKETLPMRPARGATLAAITTGLARRSGPRVSRMPSGMAITSTMAAATTVSCRCSTV